MASPTKTTWALDVMRSHRNDILKLVDEYGAMNVRVFGSVARGDATPDSDIDLLVTVKPGTTIFDLVALWQDIQELLGSNVSLASDSIKDERF